MRISRDLLRAVLFLTSWCREIPDEEFFQSSTNRMGMSAEGAELQIDDSTLRQQVNRVGYRVYLPLCDRTLEMVRAALHKKGLSMEHMEPWEAEMNSRLKSDAR